MRENNFKETEIGLIPEDWDIVSLGDIGEVRMCKRIMKYQTNESGDIPFFKIGTFGGEADSFISNELYEEYKSKYHYPQKGDILLSAAGTIGRTVVFDGKPSYFQDSNIVWIANSGKVLSNDLLYFIYKTLSWTTESGTIPRIYNSIVRSIKFAIPKNKEEQTRIATALTDIDSLIDSLDSLIAKKQAIKEGSMQQLLTGKKRLEGFSEPWEKRKLGDIEFKNGQILRSTDYKIGEVPVIAGGKTPAGFHNISNRPADTITISGSGAYAGYVGFHRSPIFASDCSTINEQQNIDIKYLYFYLVLVQEEIYKCQAGGAQPHVHAKDVKDISLPLPSSKDEQIAISNILSNMDNEIEALKQKRDKYKAIKEGMMQQLLTGKIRLL